MSRSIFGWSYPPGCSGPPGGNMSQNANAQNARLLMSNLGNVAILAD